MNSDSVYIVDDAKDVFDDSNINSEQVTINIPVTCDECKSNNFYLWGTNINNKLKIDIKCIKCGKIASKLGNKI